MNKEIPFDDDVMTLIMGLGGPEEPGQHGRKNVPMPEKDTVDLITQIRDLCEEFLQKCGKGKGEEEKPKNKDLGDGDEEKPDSMKDEEEEDV